MATENKTAAAKTAEEQIAELQAKLLAEQQAKEAALAEKSTYEDLLKEANEKAKASVEVPTVKIDGKLYKINVPKVTTEGGDIVTMQELDEKTLKGFIGEALTLID